MQMFRNTITLAGIALLMALIAPGRTNAAFTVTFAQVGNDVVATGTGSLDLTGVTNLGTSSIYGSRINPASASIKIGSTDFERVYRVYFATTTGFGSDVYRETTTGTGYHVGFLAGIGSLYLSPDYVSGTQFNSTTTFAGTTVAGLGLTAGTYTYDYSATQGGAILDRFIIQVGPGAVPEPSSALLCAIAGLGGLAIRSARRRLAS